MFSMSDTCDIQRYKYIESKRMAKDMHANSNHESCSCYQATNIIRDKEV